MGSNYSMEYAVDIVMCIDATGSMGYLIDLVKKNALNFYNDLTRVMLKKGKHVDTLRVRVIVFRDYLADGENAMMASSFFTLPEQSAEYESLVSGIRPMGGGDAPEDGLEALAYAIKSKWTKEGAKRRHIIVVWTDDGTHDLGFGRKAANYPSKMAASFGELTEWWGDGQMEGFMDKSAKRLLLFAPNTEHWSTISDTWDNTLHFPSEAGKGLGELDYETILNTIANSI